MERDDEQDDDSERCPHEHLKHKYGGTCCLDCGEMLVEPDGGDDD